MQGRRLQRKSAGSQHWMREKPSSFSSSYEISSGHFEILSQRTKMHQDLGHKYRTWTSIRKHKEQKADGHNYSSPARWMPTPLSPSGSPFFPNPAHHWRHQAGLPTQSTLRRLGSPRAPRCFHFPFMGTSPFSAKKGSQEAMWELNTRLGYNRNESIQRAGCLFLWQ